MADRRLSVIGDREETIHDNRLTITVPEEQEQIIYDAIELAEFKGFTEVANYLELADDAEAARLFTDETGLYQNLIESGYSSYASSLSYSKIGQTDIFLLNAAIAAGAYEELDALVQEIIPPEMQTEVPGMNFIG